MKIANQWADGEDSIREDQQHRMKEEGGPSNCSEDRRNKRQRFEGREAVELVASRFSNPMKAAVEMTTTSSAKVNTALSPRRRTEARVKPLLSPYT